MKFLAFVTLFVIAPLFSFAQKQAPQNWFNLDYKSDKIWGVSTEKVYKEFPFKKNQTKIIVAVIDGGTDILHEDLYTNIWINKSEIIGNKLDDDNNGYTDDVNGWNFIGGKDSMVVEDTYEYTRILGEYIAKGVPENSTPLFENANGKETKLYTSAKAAYLSNSNSIKNQKAQIDELLGKMNELAKQTGNLDPDATQVKKIKTKGQTEKIAKLLLKIIAKTGGKNSSPVMKQLMDAEDQLNNMLIYNLNLYFDPRPIVGDHYKDVNEQRYGNNRVNGPHALHGTHVAGIIAANRNNEAGIKGVCNDVQIMVLRVVPDGDERDKDVANAIRYAVDNGAKIINMSFGKTLSPYKKAVDMAISYANEKDVLIIHASGNDGKDLAIEKNYPCAQFEDSIYIAPNWIEVGASSWKGGKKTIVNFSNYGKNKVDVFAPGEDLYSCIPDNKYESNSGTSMASPIVAGIAAMIRQNYPKLTALQTKEIILQSAVKYKKKVFIPGTKKKTHLTELCKTGGIVNAYEAMKLAEKVDNGLVKL